VTEQIFCNFFRLFRYVGTNIAIEEGKTRHDSNDYDPLETYLSDDDSPGLKKNNELTIITISGPSGEVADGIKQEETQFSFNKTEL
jgi:hypothetical protein